MSPYSTQVPRRTTSEADAGDSLWTAWEEFFSAARRARGRAALRGEGGLSPAQLHLLRALAETPRSRIGELAEAAGVAPPTATRMLDGLERDGIVRRMPAADDRRAVEVELTGPGERILATRERELAKRRREVFASLSSRERRETERVLRRLTGLVDELY
jgi:MarR family transcriptional regulator, organic hydroperoxide resistance regulator